MKLLILCLLVLVGCASVQPTISRPQVSRADQKKIQLEKCVVRFIHEDVKAIDAYKICKGIYDRKN